MRFPLLIKEITQISLFGGPKEYERYRCIGPPHPPSHPIPLPLPPLTHQPTPPPPHRGGVLFLEWRQKPESGARGLFSRQKAKQDEEVRENIYIYI